MIYFVNCSWVDLEARMKFWLCCAACKVRYCQYRYSARCGTVSTGTVQCAVLSVQVQCKVRYCQYRYSARCGTVSTGTVQREVLSVQVQCKVRYCQFQE